MVHPALSRPDESEHVPYYGTYTELVPETDILKAMAMQLEKTLSYFHSLPHEAGEKRYAPGKWNVKEVIGHITDTERLFAARALYFARGVPGPLPSMEQDDWMRESEAGTQDLDDLINEYESVRQSSLYFFRHLPEQAWLRRGIASGREFTVRAIAYIIVGHERHHLTILKERYR